MLIKDVVGLTIRLPVGAHARVRALAAVTGLSPSRVFMLAFSRYYDRLPAAVRRSVDEILATQDRYRRHGT